MVVVVVAGGSMLFYFYNIKHLLKAIWLYVYHRFELEKKNNFFLAFAVLSVFKMLGKYEIKNLLKKNRIFKSVVDF